MPTLSALDAGVDEPIQALTAAVDRTFAELEGCFTEKGIAPAARRVALTTQLAGHTLQIISALRAGHPELYREFETRQESAVEGVVLRYQLT